MSDMQGVVASQSSVPWHRLRAWIDEQEAYEKQHNRPAPLSQAQKAAIQCLMPPLPEPENDDKDYVSELCQYAQAKKVDLPSYDYDPVTMVGQLRWRGYCKLPWRDNEKFPKEGYGFEKGDEFPLFQAKKKAKQFAAKQALSFLSPAKPAPISKTSPPTSPPAKKIKVEPEVEAASSDDDGGPGIFEKVAILATRLGFECPQYKMLPDGDRPNFWKGQPDFKQDARIPDGLGAVQGILGKKEAKREMAQKVLAWFLLEERARLEITERILATMDAVKNESE